QLRANHLGCCGLAVRVADAGGAVVVSLDDHDRGRVPLGGAVGLRLVRRNRADVHVELDQPLRNSVSLPRTAFSITPTRSGSLLIASAIFFACSNVMCGGSGGTSGSVFTSSTTGRPAENARSHAARISSPRSQKMPSSPQSSAYAA